MDGSLIYDAKFALKRTQESTCLRQRKHIVIHQNMWTTPSKETVNNKNTHQQKTLPIS